MAEIIKQSVEEELAEWRVMKSLLMNPYPTKENEKFNKLIEDAPARAIVKFFMDEQQSLKDRIAAYEKQLDDLMNDIVNNARKDLTK